MLESSIPNRPLDVGFETIRQVRTNFPKAVDSGSPLFNLNILKKGRDYIIITDYPALQNAEGRSTAIMYETENQLVVNIQQTDVLGRVMFQEVPEAFTIVFAKRSDISFTPEQVIQMSTTHTVLQGVAMYYYNQARI